MGFEGKPVDLVEQGRNTVSVLEHLQVVSQYIEDEVKQERVLEVGSSETAKGLGIHYNPFRVIQKKE